MTYLRIRELELKKDLPLEEKEEIAHEVIKEALAKSKTPVVSFSGGKNSLVALHLVLQHKPDIIVVYNNTTNDYPENVKYVREIAQRWHLNFHEIRPEVTFWQVVKKYGFPQAQRWKYKEPMCCYLLKTKPAIKFYRKNKIDCIFTGISAFESRVRKLKIAKDGLLYYATVLGHAKLKNPILRVHPVGYWTDEDIWAFIKKENLPINPIYEKYHITRSGCMLCTGYIGWEKDMQNLSLAVYKKIMKLMGRPTLFEFMSDEEK